MSLTNEQIEQLTKSSYAHDHLAQITLGKFFLEENKYSNSNFEKAQKFLKMAAEKHQKEGIELLIELYLRYIKYNMGNNPNFNKVNTYFKLATKWCKIAEKEGIDVSKKREEVLKLYNGTVETNQKADINYQLKHKIFIFIFVSGILFVVFLILSILTKTKVLWKNDDLLNEKLFIFFLAFAFLFFVSVCFLIYFYINIYRKKSVQAMLSNKENKMINQIDSLPKNAPYFDKLKAMFNFDNIEKNKLSIEQRGKLGELYIEFLNHKHAKFLFHFIQLKLNNYNEKFSKLEWCNKIAESTDPFDFIIYTESGKKFYMDVKTSIGFTNKIHLSTFQIHFIKTVASQTGYFICRISNFSYLNVDDFYLKSRDIKIFFFDLNNEKDKSMLEIITNTSTNNTQNNSQN